MIRDEDEEESPQLYLQHEQHFVRSLTYRYIYVHIFKQREKRRDTDTDRGGDRETRVESWKGEECSRALPVLRTKQIDGSPPKQQQLIHSFIHSHNRQGTQGEKRTRTTTELKKPTWFVLSPLRREDPRKTQWENPRKKERKERERGREGAKGDVGGIIAIHETLRLREVSLFPPQELPHKSVAFPFGSFQSIPLFVGSFPYKILRHSKGCRIPRFVPQPHSDACGRGIPGKSSMQRKKRS